MRDQDRPLARGSGIAVWLSIARSIEADLTDGRLNPGDRLATEAALAARFGVNRHTVRQALRSLADRGLIRIAQGSGTFVEARPLSYPIGARTRFSEIVLAQARDPTGILIAARETQATPAVAALLDLAPGSAIAELVTGHLADGVPISWALTAFPLPRFAGIAERYRATGSISAALGEYGAADYRRITTHVGAALADDEDARRLEIAAGRPVLVIESVNADQTGQPIQWGRSHFAADRVRLQVGP